ncbi:hypothetical protein HMPREF0204_13823 [Chryseobacterium gleum ATCC 35910]|uniref:PH domain-containing protein n=1 Tax=Chryseobacterium gleum ATCC 35910 TaxID=525257 RepID=A0ABP2IT93_CHRGE|nr:hypothetical protein HMPREF0204_13823 [Chryseobacterium gleum ATCC 35910]
MILKNKSLEIVDWINALLKVQSFENAKAQDLIPVPLYLF